MGDWQHFAQISQVAASEPFKEHRNSLEDGPDILSKRSAFAKARREWDEVGAIHAIGDDPVGGHDTLKDGREIQVAVRGGRGWEFA